jgi:multiple sugar transport system ATP-binding protein
MAAITMRRVSKSFGQAEVIKGVSLEIRDREFVVFVGPSGCGKSTLLRLIAGLEDLTSGELSFDGEVVNELAPAERGIAMVFQSYALYPHMNVYDNMAFGLKLAKVGRAGVEERVRNAARILQIEHLLERKPRQLSGGQRQRVALAATMIYVTHDQVEAMTLADRIVVLNAGVVEQFGSPLELYRHPQNLFVAGFIGSPRMNFLGGEVSSVSENGLTVQLADGAILAAPLSQNGAVPGQKVTVGLRPEHLIGGGGGAGELKGRVLAVERLGGETYIYLERTGADPLVVKAAGDARARVDEELPVGVPAAACYLFDEQGRALPRAA